MSLIQVSDLSFTYEGSYDPVFEHVSFQIDTDWKLGFTGRNGRGKTTFLNLLLKKYEYTGSITSSVVFDYFPYKVPDQERFTYEVLEALPGSDQYQFWQLQRELSKLEVAEDVLYRPFSTLSNGERTKMLLAVLFLQEGHFLLIDEPTNHLDREARRLVSRYLDGKKGYILVSHDRRFLDDCVDHILSINKTDIEVQKGNFSSWYRNKQQKDAYEQAENERLKKDIRRLKTAAKQSRDWADSVESMKIGRHPVKEETFIGTRSYLGEKSRRMQQRRKNLERRQESAIEEKQGLLKNIEDVDNLKLYPLRYHRERLAELRDVAVWYGDTLVCHDVNVAIRRGERISLQGKNGCGKSSVIKLLLGEEIPHSGLVEKPGGLKISYVAQDTSGLHGSLSAYARECGVEEQLLLTLLRKLDFSRTQFEKPMEDYSEGQKKKVLIARSLCEQAHLYIWDEPLNFIDVYSRMQVEELILKFCPTMLFVEHDEVFTEHIATEVIEMKREERQFRFVSDYKDQDDLRHSFNCLAEQTFGLNLEDWYQSGWWQEGYIPYSYVCDGKVVANISVNRSNFWYEGRERHYIQLGTVMTDPEYRHLGLSRRLMERVLEIYRDACDCLYLFANDSVLEFYPKFGFERENEYQYSGVVSGKQTGAVIRKLNVDQPGDRELLLSRYSCMNPFSAFCGKDGVTLLMFYCMTAFRENIYYLEDYDVVVMGEYVKGGFHCMDIYGEPEKAGSLTEILAAMVRSDGDRVVLGFTPKQTEGWTVEPLQEEDTTLFLLQGKENVLRGKHMMFPILSHA